MENRKGISDQLKSRAYQSPALAPATPWLGSEGPGVPTVKAVRKAGGVNLKLAAGRANALYAIWSRHGDKWRFAVAPASRVDWQVAEDAKLGPLEAVYVSAVDRVGIESARVRVI